MAIFSWVRRIVWCLPLCALAGCGGGGSSGSPANATPATRLVALVPFRDPWTRASQRWLDIDDRPFSASFTNSFGYSSSQVTLSYQTNPTQPYFIGHIEARGLKPNFSYQLKLAGKPRDGSRGWGARGDDRANEAIGRATRWWNDSTQSNTDDAAFEAKYKNVAPANRQSIYGYDYMGEFVTDSNGNASVDFDGSKAYHIVWQDKQNGAKDTPYGTFNISSLNAPFYGYGQETPNRTVKLWYEWEANRSRDVKLPPGTYNCRFLLTEETFHSPSPSTGGLWPTVLASEDFDSTGKPDFNTQNDIVFTIR